MYGIDILLPAIFLLASGFFVILACRFTHSLCNHLYFQRRKQACDDGRACPCAVLHGGCDADDFRIKAK